MNIAKIVTGVLIAAGGVLLLLTNYGLVDWAVWQDIWRFWPVLLVLWGLQLLIGKPVLNIGLILLLLLIGSALFFFYPGTYTIREIKNLSIEDIDLSVKQMEYRRELPAGLNNAALKIKYGAGSLSLQENRGDLLEGRLSYVKSRPHLAYEVAGDRAEFEVEQGFNAAVFNFKDEGFAPGWFFGLSPEVNWDLDLDIGASNTDLNLSNVKVGTLDLDAGAAKIELILGDHGLNTTVDIDAGASSIKLNVPETAAVRIKLNSALTSSNLEEAGLVKTGDYYITPDPSASATKIDITIDAGASKVHLQRISAS